MSLSFPSSLVSILLLCSLGLNLFFLLPHRASQLENTQRLRVVDGDTVIGDHDIRMRLSNVEAPELAFCGGKQAKVALEHLVTNKDVRVVTAGEDIYNRSLVFLYVGDILVNEALIREGYVRYDGTRSAERDRIRTSYEKAIEEKKGIFGPPCRSVKPDSPSCIIKGNIGRGDRKKIYHLPSCPEYSKVMVEKDLGEAWFCTEGEAVSQGYTKSSQCP